MLVAVIFSHANRFFMKLAYLTAVVSSFEGMFFRCLYILIFNSIYVLIIKVDPINIPPPMRKWLAVRAFFGFVGGNLSYLALHILQYSKAVVL